MIPIPSYPPSVRDDHMPTPLTTYEHRVSARSMDIYSDFVARELLGEETSVPHSPRSVCSVHDLSARSASPQLDCYPLGAISPAYSCGGASPLFVPDEPVSPQQSPGRPSILDKAVLAPATPLSSVAAKEMATPLSSDAANKLTSQALYSGTLAPLPASMVLKSVTYLCQDCEQPLQVVIGTWPERCSECGSRTFKKLPKPNSTRFFLGR